MTPQFNAEEAKSALSHLSVFGFSMQLCRQLLIRLNKEKVIGNLERGCRDEKIYNKAIYDMLIADPRNVETFLLEDYDDIRFTNHKTTKRGKLISVDAEMVKRGYRYIKVSN